MSNTPQDHDSLEEELKAVIETNNLDKNYNSGKALVNFIPSVGSLITGFADSYIVPPATQRLYNFLGTLVKELKELKSKNESVNFESPVFLTTFMRARQIAICNHQEQKLEALRNVDLNSSIPSSVEDNVLAIFLNWIDYFTELHISTLKCLHYLSGYTREQLHAHFPRLEEKRVIYNQILKDLEDRGLIILREDYITTEEDDNHLPQWLGYPIPQIGPDGNTMYDISRNERKMKTSKDREDIDDILEFNSLYGQESKTTDLGEQFINFIEYPPSAYL